MTANGASQRQQVKLQIKLSMQMPTDPTANVQTSRGAAVTKSAASTAIIEAVGRVTACQGPQ